MSDSAPKSIRRFGWIKPDPNAREGQVTIAASDREFSDNEWQEFNEIVGAVAEFRPFMIDFLAMTRNFDDLAAIDKQLVKELDTTQVASFFGGVHLIEAHVTCERAISNFLVSASAFRDRALSYLTEANGKESSEVGAFEQSCRDAYDSSFAYRLLYNLRNYAQHHASPLNVLPVTGRRENGGKMITAIKIELQRDALLAPKRMQPRVLAELASCDEGIPLIPLAQEYMRLHGNMMLALIEGRWQQFARFSAYMRAILEKSGMPNGATPVVWDGPPIEKVWPNVSTNMHGFSFDEFALLTRTMLRLKEQRDGPQHLQSTEQPV